MGKEQRLIRFFGDVQGVGFRYVTSRTAGDYQVAGYVRNLPDGSVECLAEGDSQEVQAFLDAVAERMRGYIRRQTQQILPHTGAYHAFDVRF